MTDDADVQRKVRNLLGNLANSVCLLH